MARASPMFSSVKGQPVGPEHQSPLPQAAGGQVDIPGDDDIIRFQVIDDVVIRRVKLIIDYDQFNPVLRGGAHPGIGHQDDP